MSGTVRSNIEPLNKCVLIALDNSPKKEGAIFIPENIKERQMLCGTVVSVAQDAGYDVYGVSEEDGSCNNEGAACDVVSTDRVCFSEIFVKVKDMRALGQEVSVELNGEHVELDKLVFVKYDKLLAKFREKV